MPPYNPENPSILPQNGNGAHTPPETAHKISSDSWLQAAFVLTTGINCAYVLGYSGTIMVTLGWVAGVIGLFLATAISMYANAILAKLHEHGGRRHIRYRDLAGFIYGRYAYVFTWVMQYVNLFMINAGFLILGGSSIKATYALFSTGDALKLPYCIIITGFVCGLFAIGIPHLSALKIWLGVSTILGLTYGVITIVLCLKDGIKSPPRDYHTPDEKEKIFKFIAALASLVFSFNTGMLPEIQATVRKPVVENMMKALYASFTIGVVPLYAIVFVGYWAYGINTSPYLLSSVHGPTWLKAMANISAFLQTVIALHIFASPMYESMDTSFGIKGSAWRPKNFGFRVVARLGYLSLNTLVSAMMPFLGDFMSLTGAISTFPLTFILANHMYYKAKKNDLSLALKIWIWINIIFFSLMALATLTASVRLIVIDSKTYHLFADM